jgi:hypothetical protein
MNFQDPQVDHHSQQEKPQKIEAWLCGFQIAILTCIVTSVKHYFQTSYQIPNARSPYPNYLWPHSHLQVVHQTHQCS